MTEFSRRNLLAFGAAGLGLAACGNGIGSEEGARIDARVDATRDELLGAAAVRAIDGDIQ